MRTALKTWLFRSLRAAGIHARVREAGWRDRRLAILCYHGVSVADEHEALPELYVTPAVLRRRLRHLRDDGYRVLALDDALRRLARGTLPARSVALTFDDGTRDFARAAVPLLREFGVPATVYATTYYADRGQPIFDIALVYVLWKGRGSGADLSEFAGRRASADEAATWGGRSALARAIRARANALGLDADAKHALLRRVAARVGVDYGAIVADGRFQAMGAEELRGLPRPLVDVQLHTHRHRVPADGRLLDAEVADNRAFLARAGVDSTADHFCYPNGASTAAAAARLRGLGVRSGTTCLPGLASRAMDPLRLPRFVDHGGVDDATFDAWVSGVAEFVPRSRAYRLDAADRERDSARPAAARAGRGGALPSLHRLGLAAQEVHEHELA